jgi:hypothetical protein
MTNPNYPVLTQEQKRRKQEIRNWKREQAKLEGEYYTYALECSQLQKTYSIRSDFAKQKQFNNIVRYSLKSVFADDTTDDMLNMYYTSKSMIDFLE